MTHQELELQERHYARIRRVKKFLRWMPRRARLESYPFIGRFAAMARRRSYLWCFKIPYVMPSIYAGTVVAFLPLYGVQIAVAFGAALLFRSNLPVAVFLQLITNPLTAPPIYYLTYRVGQTAFGLLNLGPVNFINALIMGGFITGLTAAMILDVCYRFLAWQTSRQVNRFRQSREQRRQAAVSSSPHNAPAD